MLAIGIAFVTVAVQAQSLPGKKEVLKAMTLANQYFMHKWPDPGKSIITNRERPSNIWTRAVYYEGLMELYRTDKKKAYIDYAYDWGNKHHWGLRDGIRTRNADNQCCGQTYIELFLHSQDSTHIRDIKASIDLMVQSDKQDDWNWIDALQMAMPVFTRLGVLYKDTAYFRKMYDLYSFAKYKHGTNGLYNTAEGLWWRDKDFVPPYKEPNGEDCYWSRGNGWVVAALARTIQWLPKTDTHYNEYLQDYKSILQALLPIQRADGFWNVSLHDSTHFGGRELSGTALFTYGMAWGINNGIIDKKTYLPVLLKAWNAMVKIACTPTVCWGLYKVPAKNRKMDNL